MTATYTLVCVECRAAGVVSVERTEAPQAGCCAYCGRNRQLVERNARQAEEADKAPYIAGLNWGYKIL